jgi:hypothetical protein
VGVPYPRCRTAHGFDQIIDRAGGHSVPIELLDDRCGRLLGHSAASLCVTQREIAADATPALPGID